MQLLRYISLEVRRFIRGLRLGAWDFHGRHINPACEIAGMSISNHLNVCASFDRYPPLWVAPRLPQPTKRPCSRPMRTTCACSIRDVRDSDCWGEQSVISDPIHHGRAAEQAPPIASTRPLVAEWGLCTLPPPLRWTEIPFHLLKKTERKRNKRRLSHLHCNSSVRKGIYDAKRTDCYYDSIPFVLLFGSELHSLTLKLPLPGTKKQAYIRRPFSWWVGPGASSRIIYCASAHAHSPFVVCTTQTFSLTRR